MREYEKKAQAKERKIADVVRARGAEFVTQLVTELEARGHKVERFAYSKDSGELFYPHGEPDLSIHLVDGERVRFHLEMQMAGYTHFTHTGRLRCIIGDYPRKNYPEPKKGFDLETAITRILNVVQDERNKHRAYEKKNQLRSAQAATIQRARELLGLENHYKRIEGVRFSEGDAERVMVTLMLTPEELVKLVETRCDEGGE